MKNIFIKIIILISTMYPIYIILNTNSNFKLFVSLFAIILLLILVFFPFKKNVNEKIK